MNEKNVTNFMKNLLKLKRYNKHKVDFIIHSKGFLNSLKEIKLRILTSCSLIDYFNIFFS
jgi:hypothetical protein